MAMLIEGRTVILGVWGCILVVPVRRGVAAHVTQMCLFFAIFHRQTRAASPSVVGYARAAPRCVRGIMGEHCVEKPKVYGTASACGTGSRNMFRARAQTTATVAVWCVGTNCVAVRQSVGANGADYRSTP